jgi:hypothetical protein
MEGKRKTQDHDGQKPFDSGVVRLMSFPIDDGMFKFIMGTSAGGRAERAFVPNAKGRKGMTSRQTHSTDTCAILESSTIAMSSAPYVTTSFESSPPYPLPTASLLPCFSTRNHSMFQLYCCVDSQSRRLNTTTAMDGCWDSSGKDHLRHAAANVAQIRSDLFVP